MSSIGISQSRTLSHSDPIQDTPPQVQEQEPKPLVAKLDVQARAAQTELLESIKNRPLGQRKITVDNLISKDGLKLALGKASRYAGVKDTMMRTTHRLVHHEKAGDGVGSLHKSALRLADKYEKLVEAGAPEPERLAALRELRTTLEAMQDKQVGRRILAGKSAEEAAEGGIKDMLDFVDHEIASHPTEHLAKARDLMNNTYRELKQNGASIPVKLEMLEAARDHLLAAKEAGVFDDSAQELLDSAEKDIASLSGHQPLKQELEEFVKNKDKNLRHVHTTESRPVDDMRARHQHLEHLDRVGENVTQDLRHWRVGLDIRSFDKSSLRHVTTDERTGLDAMRSSLESDGVLDDLTGMLPTDHSVSKEGVIQDPDLGSLTAHSLNSEEFNGMGARIDKALRDHSGSTQDTLAKELGLLLAGDISRQSKDVQLSFATSRGEAFKNDLLHLLSSQVGGANKLSGNYSSAKPEVRALLDKAYSVAVTHLQDRFVDDNTLVLDGVTYTKARQLGAGGMGAVYVYEGEVNGQKTSIAVKVPLLQDTPEDIREGFDTASSEARAHRAAIEGGSPHVVGFRGAISAPDGRLLIALDLETGGNVSQLGSRLQDLEKSGAVSQHAANLVRITLLKDMAEGLRHLQEVNGMTHIDLKLLNYFVSGEGVAKMGDFGLAGTSLERTFSGLPLDGIINLSPDIIGGDAEVSRLKKGITEAEKRIRERIENEVPQLPREQREDALAALNESLARLDVMKQQLSFTVDQRSDTFALGTAAFDLFHGSYFIGELTDSSFTFQQQRDLASYGQQSTPKAGLQGNDSSGQPSGFGVTALDRALNLLLHPDPEQRPSMTDLLSLSLFNEGGVGSDEVRDLIRLISDKNSTPEQIKAASDKLGI